MKTCLIACVFVSLLMSGCAVTSQSSAPLVLSRVGPPRPERIVPNNEGTLVVYSEWMTSLAGTDYETRKHRDFMILLPDGSLYRKVRNAPAALFEDPAPIVLPSGDYVVDVADSALGHVQIPVQITTNRTTTVCLTGEFDDHFKKLNLPPADLVKLADGRIVGWSSKH